MNIADSYTDFRKISEDALSNTYNIPREALSLVKRPILSEQPIAFYNKCKMFFDKSSLPPLCSDVTDLCNKCVLYGIYCNDKFYIGSTTDFGERMATHIKDTRRDKGLQMLYHGMTKTGECVSFVLGILDNETELKNAEHTIIKECKKYSVKKACNFNEKTIKFITESSSDEKKYALKYCYNIMD